MLAQRPYQQAAHDAVIAAWRKGTAPVLIEAATGAGKSIVIAMLAHTLHVLSKGKRVLCLAPSAELVKQNAAKYKAIGEPFSIFSASVSKSLRHQVIFATPGTFKAVAKRMGHQFAGVIVDECHGIMPTIQGIIEDMRETAPNLRVCGLSATPYRLGSGYIYRLTPDGKALEDSKTRDPYFRQCVYSITARDLLLQGFLTPLRAGSINAKGYDTSGLVLQKNGQFDADAVRQTFEGWGRETAAIMADVVAQAAHGTGCMVFAATVKHAEEIMASLHKGAARVITGETPKAERAQIIADFNAGRFMYLVNVAVLTTGFDSPRVSHIAILRKTESAALLQQIMGRGMRLYDGKQECLILDYAGNIEQHFPDGDLYAPEVKAQNASGGGELECRCELCDGINIFTPRPNEERFEIDQYGYFLTKAGTRLMAQVETAAKDENGEPFIQELPMPAHFGRRCLHDDPRTGEKCDYFWSCKTCPVCETENDIAARYCRKCKAELVNPNAKLITLHKERQRDPTQRQCEEILELERTHGLSKAGNDMVTVTVKTPRRSLNFYLLENNDWAARRKNAWLQATQNFTRTPRTIAYMKKGDFWELIGFDHYTDNELLQAKLKRYQAA